MENSNTQSIGMTDFGQAKAKILIVDDDVDLALNLHDILESETYTTEIIHDGQTAMAACREKTFDLVISDMKLPDISGVELIDRLAELLPEIEAIIITANATLDTAIKAVGQKHIIDYQTKPLNMDSFLGLVRQVIDDKQAREKQKNKDIRLRQQLDYILSLEHDDKEYSLDDLINLEDMQRTIISLKETESELQTKNEELIAAGRKQQSLLHALEEQNKLLGEAQIELAEALTEALQSKEEIRNKNEELLAVQEELRIVNQHLEERVEKRTAEVMKLLRQKEIFISQLGHDLRSPLTPLVALTPILREETKDTSGQELADVIERNVRYMKQLVEKALQHAQTSIQEAQRDIRDVNLSRVINDIIRRQESDFIRGSINVQNEISSEIYAVTNEVNLTEVLDNLIANAIKFMPNGGTLSFNAWQDEKFVTVSIRDTGIGLTKEQTEHIFDEFYKADESRHELGSAGLGLAICKRIIEKQGGNIRAESEGVGKGTTVYFSVPQQIGNES